MGGFSLGSLLSPALTYGTQAVSAGIQGQDQAQGINQSRMMQMIAMIRQQHEQEISDQLNQAKTGEATANTAKAEAQAKAGGFRPAQPNASVHQLADGSLVSIDKDGNAKPVTMGGVPRISADTSTGPSAGPAATLPAPPPVPLQGPAKAPVIGSPAWLEAQDADAKIRAKYQKPTVPKFTPLTTTGEGGAQVVQPFNTSTGEAGAPIANAKSGAAAGGQTRLPERTQQLGLALHNAAEALPFHDAASSPNLLSGYLGEKSQQGNQLARGALNMTTSGQAYEKYIDAINGSLLAVAHSVGGARINKEQVNMLGGNMMVSANDPPATVQQKTRAIIDFMNSARATLPPDAVAKQEASMDPNALAYLRSKGYGGPATAAGNSVIMQVKALGGPSAESTPEPNTGGKTFSFGGKTYQVPEE
jgi:hypothetical protein